MTRPIKHEYYIGIAEAVAKRSTCLRRQYGAVIVKDDRIISTGYNGSARGMENCCDKGVCWREEHDIPHGQQYEKCQAVHAEANAIINANPSDMIGATLYLAGFEHGIPIHRPEPCEMCYRLIVNAQISKVVMHEDENLFRIKDIDSIRERKQESEKAVSDWIKETYKEQFKLSESLQAGLMSGFHNPQDPEVRSAMIKELNKIYGREVIKE